MTAGLLVFADGGALQIAMALLVAMLSHRVYAAYEPYVDDDDDALSEVAQTQLVLVFFGSLLLFVGEHTDGERGYATDAFGAVLALVMSAGLLVAVYYVLVDALGRDRVEREERLLLEQAEGLIHHLVPTSPKRTVAFAADEKKEIELADVYGGLLLRRRRRELLRRGPLLRGRDDAARCRRGEAPGGGEARGDVTVGDAEGDAEGEHAAAGPLLPRESHRRAPSQESRRGAGPRGAAAAQGHEPCGHLRRAPVARGGERSDLE